MDNWIVNYDGTNRFLVGLADLKDYDILNFKIQYEGRNIEMDIPIWEAWDICKHIKTYVDHYICHHEHLFIESFTESEKDLDPQKFKKLADERKKRFEDRMSYYKKL